VGQRQRAIGPFAHRLLMRCSMAHSGAMDFSSR
jgi:hypothetical protein